MTNPVNLRFQWPVSTTPGPVELRFGDAVVQPEFVAGALGATLPAASPPALSLSAAGTVRVLVDAALSATIPAPALQLSIEASETVPRTLAALAAALPAATTALSAIVTGHTLARGELTATLPPATLPAVTLASAAVDYDQALPDAIGPVLAARAQQGATIAPTPLAAGQQQMIVVPTPAAALHTPTDPLHIGTAARQQQMLAANRASMQRWQHGIPLGAGSIARHGDMLRQRRTITTPAQHSIPVGRGARSEHQERIRFRHRLRTDQQHGAKTGTRAATGHQHGIPLAKGAAVRQQQMIPVPLGWWQIAYPWPEPPIDPNAPSSPVALKFCRLADGTTALIFGCPAPQQPGRIIVPIRSTYLVINSLSLTLVPSGIPLPAVDVALDISNDSWTWAFSATLPEAAFSLVRPTPGQPPVEVLVSINGNSYRMIVENVARSREHGNTAIRVSGRGRSAFLSDPYTPVMAFSNAGGARTAQQLMQDALTVNGVSIGWSVDWGLTDWLVPAGVWSHTGNYMSAVNTIAQAAGGYVQPHPTDQVLRVKPMYPAPFWQWGTVTPDIELPTAVVQRDSLTWKDLPEYNRVFVSGSVEGVLGQVTRAGSAGDVVAPMVVDPLITHADAARQRGTAILSNTGRVSSESLRLPVLDETGIITPGTFVRYVDGAEARVGLVRGVSVSANLTEVWQTVEVESRA